MGHVRRIVEDLLDLRRELRRVRQDLVPVLGQDGVGWIPQGRLELGVEQRRAPVGCLELGEARVGARRTGLAALASDGQVDLSWDANTEINLDGYNVHRSTVMGGPYSQLNGTLLRSPLYTDLSVINGTTYYYVVTAVNTIPLESSNSLEVQAIDAEGWGRLAVGYRADLTVVDHDPLGDDATKLLETTVELTMVDGEIVFTSEGGRFNDAR